METYKSNWNIVSTNSTRTSLYVYWWPNHAYCLRSKTTYRMHRKDIHCSSQTSYVHRVCSPSLTESSIASPPSSLESIWQSRWANVVKGHFKKWIGNHVISKAFVLWTSNWMWKTWNDRSQAQESTTKEGNYGIFFLSPTKSTLGRKLTKTYLFKILHG